MNQKFIDEVLIYSLDKIESYKNQAHSIQLISFISFKRAWNPSNKRTSMPRSPGNWPESIASLCIKQNEQKKPYSSYPHNSF